MNFEVKDDCLLVDWIVVVLVDCIIFGVIVLGEWLC